MTLAELIAHLQDIEATHGSALVVEALTTSGKRSHQIGLRLRKTTLLITGEHLYES